MIEKEIKINFEDMEMISGGWGEGYDFWLNFAGMRRIILFRTMINKYGLLNLYFSVENCYFVILIEQLNNDAKDKHFI